MSLNATPNANRLHITVYGRRNSGKSSLLNAITGQDTALVSEIAGTTTDPVSKAIELRGIGACVLTDTAGFDDEGELGMLRIDVYKRQPQDCPPASPKRISFLKEKILHKHRRFMGRREITKPRSIMFP